MVQPLPTERRRHPRQASQASLTLHHAASQRDFPARCLDVSDGGLLAAVPLTMPVRVAQEVEVSAFDPQALGEPARRAVVVRVERDRLLRQGQLAVALNFY